MLGPRQGVLPQLTGDALSCARVNAFGQPLQPLHLALASYTLVGVVEITSMRIVVRVIVSVFHPSSFVDQGDGLLYVLGICAIGLAPRGFQAPASVATKIIMIMNLTPVRARARVQCRIKIL